MTASLYLRKKEETTDLIGGFFFEYPQETPFSQKRFHRFDVLLLKSHDVLCKADGRG